jgi:hypothetical protein
MMEGPGADSEEKHEPVSDIDTAVVVVGLKALDPEWPIREAIDPQRKWDFVAGVSGCLFRGRRSDDCQLQTSIENSLW